MRYAMRGHRDRRCRVCFSTPFTMCDSDGVLKHTLRGSWAPRRNSRQAISRSARCSDRLRTNRIPMSRRPKLRMPTAVRCSASTLAKYLDHACGDQHAETSSRALGSVADCSRQESLSDEEPCRTARQVDRIVGRTDETELAIVDSIRNLNFTDERNTGYRVYAAYLPITDRSGPISIPTTRRGRLL